LRFTAGGEAWSIGVECAPAALSVRFNLTTGAAAFLHRRDD